MKNKTRTLKKINVWEMKIKKVCFCDKGGQKLMKKIERIKKVESLAIDGFTSDEIIQMLNISRRTLERYAKENATILKALKTNDKEISKLIRTAYKVATGYKRKVQKIVKTNNGYDVVGVEEEVPASPDMIKYILNNRAKDKFSNNPNKDRLDRELLELRKKEIESKIIE